MLSLLLRKVTRDLRPALSFIPRRTYLPKVKTSEKSYRRKDKIDESFSIIYKAPMEYYLLTCNYVTTASAAIFGIFAVLELTKPDKSFSTERVELEGLSTDFISISELDYILFAASMLVFCGLIRMILYKYPLRIYRNQTDYIAVFEGHVPMTRTKLSFEKGTVKELPPTGIMPWKEHRFSIKDKSTIMYFEYFRTPAEFYSMFESPKKVK